MHKDKGGVSESESESEREIERERERERERESNSLRIPLPASAHRSWVHYRWRPPAHHTHHQNLQAQQYLYIQMYTVTYTSNYMTLYMLVMGNIPSISWYRGVDYQYLRTSSVPWYQFCIKHGSTTESYKTLWLPQKIGQPDLKVEMSKL